MIVSKWTGTEVRALRTAALRMTQEEFAETLGFVTPTVQKWEQRATIDRPVVGRSAEALDTLLSGLESAPSERFRIALAEAYLNLPPSGSELLSAEGNDEMKRREFGILAGITLAAPLVDVDAPRVGVSDAQRLALLTDQIEQQACKTGGAPLVRAVFYQLEQMKRVLDTCIFDTGAAASAFTAEVGNLAATASWLAFDATMHPHAKRCVTDAFSLGNQAGADDVTVHACVAESLQTLALTATGQGSARHALRLTGHARNLLRGRPSGRIHAAIATRDAQAHAQLGDAQGFSRAVATAWRELAEAIDNEPIETSPVWLRFVTYSEIRFHEARGYARLGNTDRAVQIFNEMERDAPGRNTTFYRAGKAATFASGGDFANAISESLPVLADLADGLASPRTIKMLEPMRLSVADLPVAEEFRRRFDALACTVTV
ncbi:helix-turn-helix domain-containing protein [Nocardia sp. NBC_01327]|uniref:helix-turn-helix domain-containing protein n=1 Tax=Nocardia sp. NBC_01327 TaxID=2903593 RepID=UPI002E0E7881|nr:hypothetical protein OG326_31100 [Nocardia sp. NBC_01327]